MKRSETGERGEEGSALVEFIAVGLVLLVPMIWILMAVFDVQRGAYAVEAAARAAGRAYVLAPDAAIGLERARQIARFTLDDQGVDGMPLEVSLACASGGSECEGPGERVTVTVTSGIEVLFLPELLAAENGSFELVASHTLPAGDRGNGEGGAGTWGE